MRIEVTQLPPASASPNSRIDRRAASVDKLVYQNAIYFSAMETVGRTDLVPQAIGRCRVDLHFVFPEHRRRDRDNLIARFKGGLDALVLCGLLIDDRPEYLTPGDVTWEVDPARAPLTIIEITEVGA